MKRTILFLLLLGAFMTAMAQKGYTVRVKIRNLEGAKIFLAYPKAGNYVFDTNAVLKNGVYTFKGKVEEPTLAKLVVRKPSLNIKMERGFIPSPGLSFVLDNDVVDIDADANEGYMATVKGGKSNNEWNSIRSREAKLTDEGWKALVNAHAQFEKSKDSAVFKVSSQVRSRTSKEIDALQLKFIKDHPNSFVSVQFLSGMFNKLTPAELENEYNRLELAYKSTTPAKQIAEKIETMKKTAIGKAAINLHKKDMNGNIVNLDALKGKYVLLDFWGSWCMPCRRSHPHLKSLYAKYKEKGFEIVGIATESRASLEETKKVWKKAIEEDGINWIQVLNNEDIDTFDVVKSYGVSAFPTKILLDKEGKIIARNVGDGEEIDKTLKEIFGF